MNGGSGGEAVGSMEDGNDEMWERFFALPDMDQDRNAEWCEGPSAALGGAGSKGQRTDAGDSDDVGDGEDADVSVRLGVWLGKNQCIRAKKQRGDPSLSCMSVTFEFTCCVFCNHQ